MPRKPPRKITDEMLDVARDLIAAGVTMREAAAALDCVDSTLRSYGFRADSELRRQWRAEWARSLRKRWTRDLIVAAIAAWAERYAAGDWPFYPTVVKYFGSWSAAIEAAGWHSRPRGNATEGLRAETLAEVNARLPVDEQMVPVFGENGEGRAGAYAMRRGPHASCGTSSARVPASARARGHPTMARPEHPRHPFVRALHRALVEDARTDVLLALRVQVLAERGCTNGQIAARLGASTAAVHVAFARLRRVRLLDRDDEL